MKQLWVVLVLAALVTGCATYNAAPLSVIQTHLDAEDGVQVSAKALSKSECKTYLDRDVIRKGYQPVHIAVSNSSKKTYVLRRSGFDVSLADPGLIASLVHTSTAGRVVAYSVGGIFFAPLFIPAFVDGFSSAEANKRLDADFREKALGDVHMIPPHTTLNKVIFVPRHQMRDHFFVHLTDAETEEGIDVETEIK